MKKTIFAALVASMFAMSAMADPVTLKLTGFEHAGAPGGTVTVGTEVVGVGVGGLQATAEYDFLGFPLVDSFIAYCIEIFAPAPGFGSAGVEYDRNGLDIFVSPDALNRNSTSFTATESTRLANLFAINAVNQGIVGGLNGDAGATDDKFTSAAMQLAIWNILYDNDLSVTAGTFKVMSGLSSYTAETDALLAGLDSYVPAGFVLLASYNNGFELKTGKQDFISATFTSNFGDSCGIGNSNACVVPEPGSLALAGLGLLGMGAVTRRRKAAVKA